MKKAVSTNKAPAAIGPYSQAVFTDNFLYVSGQLPVNPVDGKMADSIEAQAQASLNNIDAILSEAGFSRGDVVKTTIFLKDMGDFAKVNEVYGHFFEGTTFPARSTIEVSRLPKDASIEIEAFAYKKSTTSP